MDRREVVRGTAGLAAAALLPGVALGREEPGSQRQIPSSGVPIPAVGLGSWITFNVGSDPVLLERSSKVVAAFVDEGGGVIDSSPMYGSSQATIGHALRNLGYPTSVLAVDKIWTSAAEGQQQWGQTRARWGIERFDILQVHNLIDWEAHLDFLFALKDSGELGYVGVTTSHGRRHRELEQIMAAYPIDFVQLTYNLGDREAARRLLPLALEKGIGVIVNRPFRRGALVDALRNEPIPGLARELGATSWAQMLLKFVLAHPAITCVIPATTREDHVRENKRAALGPLPDARMQQQLVEQFAQL